MDCYHPPKTEYVYYVSANAAENTEDVKREVRSAYGSVAKANNQNKSYFKHKHQHFKQKLIVSSY